MELLYTQYLPNALAVISLLAFLASIITELIKEIGFIKKIPTNLLIIIVSIILTVLSYIIYCDILKYSIYWYGIIGSIFGGFIIAYIATFGWEKFNVILLRFRKQRE